MNHHFCGIGPQLAASIPDIDDRHLVENHIDGFNLNPVTAENLYKLLCELPPSKSCGTHRVTARLIKACGDSIVLPLLNIINLSISTNTFPENSNRH